MLYYMILYDTYDTIFDYIYIYICIYYMYILTIYIYMYILHVLVTQLPYIPCSCQDRPDDE